MLMNRVKAREMVQALLDLSNKIDCSDRRAVDSLREKTAGTARQVFGDDTVYVKVLREIKFHPENISALSNSTIEANRARALGVGKLAMVLREMLMEILTGR
jgi:hypothetical protein